MAALPEDDGPTMTGAPGGRRVDHALQPPIEADGSDDTTTAEAGPPAARRDDTSADSDDTGAQDPHDHEDRTVQQKVDPPHSAGKPSGLSQRAAVPAVAKPPSAAPPRLPIPVPAAGAPPSAPPPSTEPDAGVSTAPAPAARAITQTTEIETDIADELDGDPDDDDEPIEDSITATAPRLNHANLMAAAQSGHGVPIEIPGSVEIRTVEHDDLLDETEIRTRPGHSPLHIPEALRGSPAPTHGSSQPPPPPRPAAGRPPDISPDTENDDDDDGVTAQSLAPVLRGPDTAPQSRPPHTQASLSAGRAASPRPAAGMPFQPDIVEDPPTRPGVEGAVDEAEEPATRPGVEGAEEPATRPGLAGANDPPTRPGLGELPTRPVAPDPETAQRLARNGIDSSNSYANEDDDDESVTTRARVADYDEKDESVTTQAPNVPPSIIEAAIKATPNGVAVAALDDGTDGTTQKVNKTREGALVSPADGEAESITTQAPGLTNILRVIASGSSPSLGSDPALPLLDEDEDEDEQPENRTAVMVNAPLKRIVAEHGSASALPAIRPTGGPMIHGPQGSAAPRLEPSSESGLRVARAGGVDRASLGALGIAGDANARNSGVGRTASALASDGSISAPMDHALMNGEQGHFLAHGQPSVHDVDLGKGPRYGLLVAIVAVISVIVPVTLFIALHHPAEPLVPGVPAEPASEIEKHDGARVKAVRGKNGQLTAPSASVAASASAAPSTAASTKPGAKGFPFRR